MAVFTKYPEEGKVKTRLASVIGNKKSMILYRSMLIDILENLKSGKYEIALCFTPEDKKLKFKELLGVKLMHPQAEGNLGDRMENCFKHFLSSYKNVIVIGSDILDINSNDIIRSFELLEHKDIVLGKADDGGYYLVGMGKFHDIFSGIKWSTEEVFEDTLVKIKNKNLSLGILNEKADIDEIDDLRKIKINPEEFPNTFEAMKMIKYSFNS